MLESPKINFQRFKLSKLYNSNLMFHKLNGDITLPYYDDFTSFRLYLQAESLLYLLSGGR